jgi:GNAT superfamily N-acetyltransferase
MIINIKDTSEFFDFISDNIEQYDFRYKYLIKVLKLIYGKEIPVNVNSFINEEEDGGWIIFIEIEGWIYIYGLAYSEFQISHFIETIDLKKYNGFEIMGTLDLVYKILKESEIQTYKIIKDRYFYQLINYDSEPIENNIEFANSDDLDELVLMFQSYYSEEYNGERNKSADFLIPTIKSFIQDQSLFVIKIDDTITTFCSVINPDIGIIFTKEKYRRQGLGRRLLEYCSSLLFEENEVAYLMTDKHNSESNKICQKIGYDIIYEHTNLKI